MSTDVRRRFGWLANSGRTLERARRFVGRQRLRYLTWRRCGHAYAAPIDPFRVVWVDPGAVTHVLPRDRRDALERDRYPYVQSVEGGDWDLDAERFVETACYQSLRDRFDEGARWLETDYATVLERDAAAKPAREGADDGRPRDRAGTLRLHERYAALESAYERVETEGELLATGPSPAAGIDPTFDDPRTETDVPLPPSKRALLVDVGRDGRLVLHRGRHRLAIARLVDLETVPVHVLVRHERWQARRDRLVLTGAGDGDHPDLAGLEPE